MPNLKCSKCGKNEYYTSEAFYVFGGKILCDECADKQGHLRFTPEEDLRDIHWIEPLDDELAYC